MKAVKLCAQQEGAITTALDKYALRCTRHGDADKVWEEKAEEYLNASARSVKLKDVVCTFGPHAGNYAHEDINSVAEEVSAVKEELDNIRKEMSVFRDCPRFRAGRVGCKSRAEYEALQGQSRSSARLR